SCQLGADQAQDHRLAPGHESQGLEATGARIVVLEGEGVYIEGIEQLLGDGVVAALGVPLAAVVATAEVDAGEYTLLAGDALEAGVVDADGLVQGGIRLQAHLVLHVVTPLWVDVVAVAGGVQLDVSDILPGEVSAFVLDDLGTVPEEGGVVRVESIRQPLLVGDG